MNCKLDTVSSLSEPRENFYMEFALPTSGGEDSEDEEMKSLLARMGSQLQSGLGRVKTSRTLPSLCRVTVETVITHLEALAVVRTVDYNGAPQQRGGDPVKAEVTDDKGDQVEVKVADRDDGSYEVRFTAHRPVTYCLKVMQSTVHRTLSRLHYVTKPYNIRRMTVLSVLIVDWAISRWLVGRGYFLGITYSTV